MRYKLFLFLCAPAQAWQMVWAKILGCHFSTTEAPPNLAMGKMHGALLMFQRGEISFGKMRKCCTAWKQDMDFLLPDTERD